MKVFKKKVSPEVIAAGLFKFLEGQAGMEQLDRIIADIPEPDKSNVHLELKLLEVAATLLGIYQALRNTPEGNAIRDAFYGFLLNEAERFFGCSTSFVAPKLSNRPSRYAKALNTPHEL